MQEKPKIIIAGEDASVGAMAEILANRTQAEIVQLKEDMILGEGNMYPIHKKIDLPDLSMFGQEKKKKKPCTYHEYVNKGSKEISPNVYSAIWECRHCGHPLQK